MQPTADQQITRLETLIRRANLARWHGGRVADRAMDQLREEGKRDEE
jgi:hypothetical protein